MMPTLMNMPEAFMQLGSIFATLMFAWAFYHQYLPHQIRSLIESSTAQYGQKAVRFFSPYLDITFDEYSGQGFFDRSEVYTAVQTYVSERSPATARRMKANSLQGKSLMLSMAEYEEVSEEYEDGVKVWWTYNRSFPQNSTISFYPGEEEKRFYKLTFHRRDRKLITNSYLNHVLEEGKAIAIRKRTRKLYTNTHESQWVGHKRTMWSHIAFKHPGRFETLAMNPEKKQQIVDDLLRFSEAKDYYEKVGKAWKRGYLLYGPPGTGKSTMVAAIANLLEYDIYDLELAAVKDNIMLRKLLIETSNKSIILIEDIDCSIDLTGKRKEKNEEEEKEDSKDEKEKIKKALLGEKKGSEVTLSGLLNFIDGIWSACGEERIIIFTTNYVDKLDPALIRRGRMDMRIELSYCCFEAFKVLAKNYLDLDSHPLFGEVERLLGETETTPADVAENLMPKTSKVDIDVCMRSLVDALEKAKVEAKERKQKEEEEAKAKEKEDAEKKAMEEKKKVQEKEAKEEDTKIKEENKFKIVETKIMQKDEDSERFVIVVQMFEVVLPHCFVAVLGEFGPSLSI
ncbi:hypothetical protein V2J09_012060 [Rumex salicifolius]